MAKTRFGSLDGIHSIKKYSALQSTLISALLFLVILTLFLLAIARTSRGSVEGQKEILAEAIDRAVVQCYVTEGRYPESFSYLKDNYGIIYDDELFRVDYTIFGTNMKPQVMIITLED